MTTPRRATLDTIARSLATAASRREAMAAAALGTLGLVAGTAGDASAAVCRPACVLRAECKDGRCYYPKGYPFHTRWKTRDDGAGFYQPRSLAVTPDGRYVMVVNESQKRIFVYTRAGQLVTWFGSQVQTDEEYFAAPTGVAIHPGGQLVYVTDHLRHRIKVLHWLGNAFRFVAHWDAEASDYPLDSPHHLAVSPYGTVLYVTEPASRRIKVLSAGDGTFSQVWSYEPGAGKHEFNVMYGIAVSPGGTRVYVADQGNDRIKVLTTNGELITNWGPFGALETKFDGFKRPWGVGVDGKGQVYVTNKDQITVLSPGGKVLDAFGRIGFGTREFQHPTGVAVASRRNVFVADEKNRRIQVLRF